VLEAMSTICFLQQRGFADVRLRQRFGELKPSLVDQYERALGELDRIRQAGAKAG